MTRLGNLFNPKIHSLIRLLFVALLVGGMLSQSFGQLSLADSSFHVGPGTQSPRFADNCVNSIVVLADGRILVGGIFTGIAGVARTNLACLNHDGTPDLTFPGTANGPVQKLLVQSDGKILIGGSFSNLQGTACLNLGRLLTNGLVDPDFDAGTNFADMDGIYDLAQQTNGSIVVSGWYQRDSTEYASTLRRLEPDGHLDDSFNNTNLFLYWTAQCLLIRTNGEILVGGGFFQVNDLPRTAFAAFDADGNLKTNYNTPLLPGSDVAALNELPDGSLLLGGNLQPTFTNRPMGLAELTPALEWNTNFITDSLNFGSFARSILVQPDGKIVLGGFFDYVGSHYCRDIIRLDLSGKVDSRFASGLGVGDGMVASWLDAGVFALALQPDGKILVGGRFAGFDGLYSTNIVRLLPQSDPEAPRIAWIPTAPDTYCVAVTGPPDVDFLVLQSSSNLVDWNDIMFGPAPFAGLLLVL